MDNELLQEKANALAKYLEIDADEIELPETDEPHDVFHTPEGEFTVMTEDEADEAFTDGINEFVKECGIGGFTEWFQNDVYNYCINEDKMEEVVREYIEGELDDWSDEEKVSYARDAFVFDEDIEEYINQGKMKEAARDIISDEVSDWDNDKILGYALEKFTDAKDQLEELGDDADAIEDYAMSLVDRIVENELDEIEEQGSFFKYLENELGEDDVNELLEDDQSFLSNITEDIIEDKLSKYDGCYSQYIIDTLGEEELKTMIEQDASYLDMDKVVEGCLQSDGYGNQLAAWDGNDIELDGGFHAFQQDNNDTRSQAFLASLKNTKTNETIER